MRLFPDKNKGLILLRPLFFRYFVPFRIGLIGTCLSGHGIRGLYWFETA